MGRYMEKLFNSKKAYDLEGTEELFLQAMRENCEYHYKHCSDYRKILDSKDFKPDDMKTIDDLEALPFIPTAFFKRHHLFSMSQRRMVVKATSSGTSGGVFSKIGFEWSSLLRALKMSLRLVKYRELFTLRPCNYIMFGYKPHRSNKKAVTKSAMAATLLAPALHRTYALTYKNGNYTPDFEAVINAIVKYSKLKTPVRFMGFPSYTFFVIKMLKERGIKVTLPPHSKILLGGGWKQFYKEAVEKDVFYAMAKEVLGVEEQDIVEFFGAVEHPILYCECKKHHFHVPIYSRVLIRDVSTFKKVPNGKIGLVNLFTPEVNATPIISVMTDDLGILHDASECGCGIDAPFIEIIGRVGLKDIKTCAAGAADLLSNSLKEAGK